MATCTESWSQIHIKTTTPEAIRQLHEENIRIVMLAGDSRTTARR
jgi:Cu+-exporting ATPase